MKKLFSLCVALLCATTLFAYDFEVDGIYYNRLGGDSVEVTHAGYNRYYNSGSVTIPETVSYSDMVYRITTIGGGRSVVVLALHLLLFLTV